MLITDGAGTSTAVAVTDKHELVISTASAIHEAALRGDAYAWNAVSSVIGSTDVLLYVRNLSATRLLVINRIYAYADVVTDFDVHIQTSSTAFGAAGTAVVGVNLNTASAKVADGEGYHDDDDVASGTIILTLHTNESATDLFAIDYPTNDEIVLGTNGCIGVDLVGNPAAIECTIIGYYVDA